MSTQAASPQPRSGMAQEQVLGKAYDMQLMLRLWRFVKPHWRLLILSLLLIPVAVGFELAQPWVLKIAVEEHIAVGTLDGLGTLVLAFVGLVICQSLSSYAQLYALQLLGQRSMHSLRLSIYEHILRLRTAFFDRMPVGRLLTRMTNDVENINEMFASGVITLVADLIKLLAIVGMMLWMDVELTLMTFLVLPLLVLVVDYARRLMRSSFRAIRVKLAAMNSFAQEHLSGMKVVQLFAREQQAMEDYGQINADHRDAYLGAIRADASMYALVEAIGVVSIAAVAWYASRFMDTDPATLGVIVAFIEYIRKFFIPVRDLSAKYTVMQSAMASSERVMALLDVDEPDAPMHDDPTARSGARHEDPARARGEEIPAGREAAAEPAVSLRDVHFAYRTGEDVLRGVGFDIARSSTVAVVGATGSGKSTIIKLLARLYEIDRGEIRIDGRDIREIPAQDLRRRITVVSQDVFLFSGTVADNVRLGNLEASDEDIRDALRRVGADRMLAHRLQRQGELDKQQGSDQAPPDPLNIEIAERGSNFSAGERQLLAFARALVRDPEILVLDEATAHVDPEAEAWIEQGLAALMRARTTLVIAHRLSTIRNADQIVVMSRGKVAEQGTHDELLERGGVYARLERTFARTD